MLILYRTQSCTCFHELSLVFIFFCSRRFGSPTPNNNTVITKLPLGHNGGSPAMSHANGKSTPTGVAAKSYQDALHGGGGALREPHRAPFNHMVGQPSGSAIVDTFLQYIAENSGMGAMNLSSEQAAAYAAAHAKIAHMNALDKLSGRPSMQLEDYPMIGRDDPRMREDRANADPESSACEDEPFSDNDEPEALKAE